MTIELSAMPRSTASAPRSISGSIIVPRSVSLPAAGLPYTFQHRVRTQVQCALCRLQTLDRSIVSHASPPLRAAFTTLDFAIVDLVNQANLNA